MYFGTDDYTISQKIGDIDVLQEVKNADFVMLAYSTVGMYKLGSGFSERVLDELGIEENENYKAP